MTRPDTSAPVIAEHPLPGDAATAGSPSGQLQPELLLPKERLVNYQLSWLKFNWRVLDQALDTSLPLLERVKFIGIVCSNLDEFFQKRVGGLKKQVVAGVTIAGDDGFSPTAQLKAIRTDVKKMIETYRDCFLNKLVPALKKEGVHFVTYKNLEPDARKRIDHYFDRQLYPILTPLAVDSAHPFPFISNQSRSLAVELRNPKTGELSFARVKIPSNRPRWLVANQGEETITLVVIDEVIQDNVQRLFPGMEILSANVFRVTRSADVERNEEEADDLLELIEGALRERRFADIVRLEIEASTPEHIKNFLLEKMSLKSTDMFEMNGPIGLVDCFQLYDIPGFKHLKEKPAQAAVHPVFKHAFEETSDYFSVMRRGDFLVHHPYQSFASTVQRFIEEAAEDPRVLAIKQTLYRTSKDSPIMHALMRAADNGKQVAVLVELKARFDEERNIEWAQRLEKAGVHVAYGLPGLKIHSKVTVVVREENDALQRYCHIGTGNYNPSTARVYEDLGLFTTDPVLGSDVSDLFNYLTGYAPAQSYSKLLVAPNYMRPGIVDLIQFEIDEARAGRPARIIAKTNALEDFAIIEKLYEASQAGVQIDLFCRSVCRLVPGKKGLSENIRAWSIVGKNLEHSRVFHFHHNGEERYYIGSADWMHRNLDYRVEVLTPIEHPRLKKYLAFMLNLYLKDNYLRWELQAGNKHVRLKPKKNEMRIAVHDALLEHHHSGAEPVARTTG
jgi:polyphosphate kinase